MLDELRRMDWVPRSIHDKARKVQAVVTALEQAHGQLPQEAQIAQALKMSHAAYAEMMEEIRPAAFVCLDAAPAAEWDGEESHHESIADEAQENPVEGAARRELASLIADRLQALPPMQRQVLALYYFEDLRLREIAATFGVTESRICQIHAQAVRALRIFMEKQGIIAA
jgi:RNA polymerase sigma factor for flagellar operon FliA